MFYFLDFCRFAGAIWRTSLEQLQSSSYYYAPAPGTRPIVRDPDSVSVTWIALIPLTAIAIGLFLCAIGIEGGIGPLLSACAFYALFYSGLPLLTGTPANARPALKRAIQIEHSAAAVFSHAVSSLITTLAHVARVADRAIRVLISIALIPFTAAVWVLRQVVRGLAFITRWMLSVIRPAIGWSTANVMRPAGRAIFAVVRAVWRTAEFLLPIVWRAIQSVFAALGRLIALAVSTLLPPVVVILKAIAGVVGQSLRIISAVILGGVSIAKGLVARISFVARFILRAALDLLAWVVRRLIVPLLLLSKRVLASAFHLLATVSKVIGAALLRLVKACFSVLVMLVTWVVTALAAVLSRLIRVIRSAVPVGVSIVASAAVQILELIYRLAQRLFSLIALGVATARVLVSPSFAAAARFASRGMHVVGWSVATLASAVSTARVAFARLASRAFSLIWRLVLRLRCAVSFLFAAFARLLTRGLSVLRHALIRLVSAFTKLFVAIARLALRAGSRIWRGAVAWAPVVSKWLAAVTRLASRGISLVWRGVVWLGSRVLALVAAAARPVSRGLALIGPPLMQIGRATLRAARAALFLLGSCFMRGVSMVSKPITGAGLLILGAVGSLADSLLSLLARVVALFIDAARWLSRLISPILQPLSLLSRAFAYATVVFVPGLLIYLVACGPLSRPTLRIVAGSGYSSFEKILTQFGEKNGWNVSVEYLGSLDIALRLQANTLDYDAIWDGDSMWTMISDPKKLIKHRESTMLSPIVLGLQRPLVDKLGWAGRQVSMQEILAAAESEKLRIMMTSATQSNSGTFAYLGMLYAFANPTDALTSSDLQNSDVQAKVKRLLGRIDRLADSSGTLRDLFEKEYDLHDAMFNYESHIIELNQRLVKSGKQPLYIVYPSPGLGIADFPFSYVDRGDPKKEEFFLKLQKYLLSQEVQAQFAAKGRRTFACGTAPRVDLPVFNPDSGVDITKGCAPLRLPSDKVIHEALNLYQTLLRKPSFTVFLLDSSGSMGSGVRSLSGMDQLKSAMHTLLDQDAVAPYFLQAAPDDITLVIPFNHQIMDEWHVEGNAPANLQALDKQISALSPTGNTDLYTPVARALMRIKAQGLGDRLPAIILMTDGKNTTDRTIADVKRAIVETGLDHVPVYGITFGDADVKALQELADLTSGRVYDGTKDLLSAFRKARGNN